MEQKRMNRSRGKKALRTLFVIGILLSAVVEALICRGGAEWLFLALMWTTALAAGMHLCEKKQAKHL